MNNQTSSNPKIDAESRVELLLQSYKPLTENMLKDSNKRQRRGSFYIPSTEPSNVPCDTKHMIEALDAKNKN
jgi:hypothetical protein